MPTIAAGTQQTVTVPANQQLFISGGTGTMTIGNPSGSARPTQEEGYDFEGAVVGPFPTAVSVLVRAFQASQYSVVAAIDPATQAALPALVSGAGNGVRLPLATSAPQLSAFSSALAATIAGTADTKIAFVGDSTTMGAFGAGVTYVGARPFCRADKFADFLRSVGVTAYKSSFFGDSSTTTILPTYDTRITLGANWVSNTLVTLGGTCLQHNTNGSLTTLTFAPTEQIDTVDVYYIQNTGYGSARILIDGVQSGAALTGAGSLAIIKATRTMTPGVHTIGINKTVDGNFFVTAIDAYNSTARGVRCWNMGAGGVKAGDVSGSAAVYDPTSLLKTYAPDLTVINLGINDWKGATAAATYQAAITAIVDAARLSGDVIIEVPIGSSYADTTQVNQELITFALRQTAANKGVPIADLNAAFRNYTSGVAAGYFLPANDLIHPGPTGYAFASTVLARALFR